MFIDIYVYIYLYMYRNYLLSLISPRITGKPANISLSQELKLSLKLRYRATGETLESLMYQFLIHKTTIAKFIHQVCDENYQALNEKYLEIQSTKEELEKISDKNEKKVAASELYWGC